MEIYGLENLGEDELDFIMNSLDLEMIVIMQYYLRKNKEKILIIMKFQNVKNVVLTIFVLILVKIFYHALIVVLY